MSSRARADWRADRPGSTTSSSISRGTSWRGESPSDDSYSRVSDPERYVIAARLRARPRRRSRGRVRGLAGGRGWSWPPSMDDRRERACVRSGSRRRPKGRHRSTVGRHRLSGAMARCGSSTCSVTFPDVTTASACRRAVQARRSSPWATECDAVVSGGFAALRPRRGVDVVTVRRVRSGPGNPAGKRMPRRARGSGALQPDPGAQRRADTSGRRSRRRSSWAFAATMMVDRLIRMAPTDIGSTKPIGASTPAASGTDSRL